jgi:hypothetical protein
MRAAPVIAIDPVLEGPLRSRTAAYAPAPILAGIRVPRSSVTSTLTAPGATSPATSVRLPASQNVTGR